MNNTFDTNDKDLISVIIPIYNVEKYLMRCIKSVTGQTYANLEIILVDDGSTDSSGIICDNAAKVDSRIIVIHRENGGLSCARNSGLEIYTGDYACFIDSDDFIDPNYIKTLYNMCKSNLCKISICSSISTSYDNFDGIDNWDTFAFQKKNEQYDYNSNSIKLFNNNELLNIYYGDLHNEIAVAWNKLYHRSVIKNTRYEPGIIHEDEATTFKFIYNAGRIAYTSKAMYYYFSRANSITGKGFSIKNLDILIGHQCRLDFYKFHNEKELYEKEYFYYMSALLINYYKVHTYLPGNKNAETKLINTYRTLCKNADFSKTSLRKKILYKTSYFFPSIYGALRNLNTN